MADRIKRNLRQPTAKDKLVDEQRREEIRKENDCINQLTCAKIILHIREEAEHEKHLADKLHPYMPYDWSTYATFKLHQSRYEVDAKNTMSTRFRRGRRQGRCT